LKITNLFVTGVELAAEGLVVCVRPRWQKPRCGGCGKRAPGYDQGAERRWRHLGVGRTYIWLAYAPRRVNCPLCGVRTEEVPWARPGNHRFTREFEELVAYLAQVTDRTTVTRLMGISWVTVGSIVERVVRDRLDESRLDGLRRIGVDEFSYRRRHRYLTTVVDHDRRRVVWAAAGHSSETLAAFFTRLGPDRCAEIEVVTIDMSGAYRKAIAAHLPDATVVFDRFHVQQLASRALDQVRRQQLRGLRGTPEGKALFRSRFVLLKNPWNLSPKERAKLRDIERANQPLFRAYLLKEMLAKALDYHQPKRARETLEDWLSWASRSRLRPFVQAARTIRKHLEGVLAYVQERLTNGVVEGINNRLRMIARRAYGFHRPEPMISMLYLCCGGIRLDPPLPDPQTL